MQRKIHTQHNHIELCRGKTRYQQHHIEILFYSKKEIENDGVSVLSNFR